MNRPLAFRRAGLSLGLLALTLAPAALAQVASSSASASASPAASLSASAPPVDLDAGSAAAADAGQVWASCMEHVPEGASRPKWTESFPEKGLTGYALSLRITLEHGLGETVLPNGFQIQQDSDAARALRTAGFYMPEPDGGSGPSLVRKVDGQRASTEVLIPFVALPEKPGRQTLTLPPVPIAIARASGELLTLCSAPHTVQLEEPIANQPEAKPQPNPPPRPQRELWTLARDLTYGLLIGAAVASLGTFLVLKWLRRPRPLPPPPPPRPAWELAMEELQYLRGTTLLENNQLTEYVDRVSDIVRRYLGGRFDFDGIESTTDEVLQALMRQRPPVASFDAIRALLLDCDLVKFARMTPSPEDCLVMVGQAEDIVRQTMPVPMAAAAVQEPTGPSAGAQGGLR